MSCQKIEELIFLYREINPNEKVLVDKHVIGCKSCSQLLKQINLQNQFIGKVAEMPVRSDNSDRIKSMIMKGIEPKQSINFIDRILFLFEHRWLQSAMGLVSIIFIAFFITEISSAKEFRLEKSNQTNIIRLDTQYFLKAFIKRRESPRTVSLYDQVKNSDKK